MSTDFAEANYYEMFIWTLLDSDTGYENSLIQHRIGTKFFIIYATSPAEERMKPLRQNFRTVHSIVMNPGRDPSSVCDSLSRPKLCATLMQFLIFIVPIYAHLNVVQTLRSWTTLLTDLVQFPDFA